MKLATSLAIVAAAIASARAAPASEAKFEDIEARDLSVFVCEGDKWSGRCINYKPRYNICEPFSAFGLTGYQSFGPGEGTTCLWYTGPSCTGTQSDAVNHPGWSTVPGFWQFNTTSWKCWN